MSAATRDEWMTVAAARMLRDRCVCFVGIGLPSAACNLARLTHAPDIVLIYESGTIGTKPDVLPLSIGDGELAETAAFVVPMPEVFAYYLQAGRVDVGFLGAAREAAMAATKLIVTVEEIVDALPPAMNGIVLPHWIVTAVVHCPGGAYPSYAQGYYARDNAFYQRWDAIAREREAFAAWMQAHVLETADHAAFLAMLDRHAA